MSTNLISGTPIILEGGGGSIKGNIVSLDGEFLRVKVDGQFFPVGDDPERFEREGDLWRRFFTDPFTGRRSHSKRESLYRLKFA